MFLDRWTWKSHRSRGRREAPKKKQLRRAQYAAIQKLYNTSQKDAAKAVLEGKWREFHLPRDVAVEGLGNFWAGVLSREGPRGRPQDHQVVPQHWAIVDPIMPAELTETLRSLRKSANGVDKIPASELLTWDPSTLAGLVNICLLTEALPPTPGSH